MKKKFLKKITNEICEHFSLLQKENGEVLIEAGDCTESIFSYEKDLSCAQKILDAIESDGNFVSRFDNTDFDDDYSEEGAIYIFKDEEEVEIQVLSHIEICGREYNYENELFFPLKKTKNMLEEAIKFYEEEKKEPRAKFTLLGTAKKVRGNEVTYEIVVKNEEGKKGYITLMNSPQRSYSSDFYGLDFANTWPNHAKEEGLEIFEFKEADNYHLLKDTEGNILFGVYKKTHKLIFNEDLFDWEEGVNVPIKDAYVWGR